MSKRERELGVGGLLSPSAASSFHYPASARAALISSSLLFPPGCCFSLSSVFCSNHPAHFLQPAPLQLCALHHQPRLHTSRMQPRNKVCLTRVTLVLVFGLLIVSSDGSKPIKRPPPKPKSCADRQEEVLEQMYGHLAAGMLSAYHHTLQLQPLEKENITCPAGRTQAEGKQQLPVNVNSISPWAYRITYNPTRYPKYIPEAYCLCKGCLTGPFGEEDFNFRSTPVYMPTVILQRTTSCTGGRYVYVEDYITIPVGCTCVPESEKETEQDSVNSSLEKEKFKVHINKNEKPTSD